jgi:hypothetical protein
VRQRVKISHYRVQFQLILCNPVISCHIKDRPFKNHVLRSYRISVHFWKRFDRFIRAGRSGDRIPVETRFSAPVQTGPGAHSASCTGVTGSFLGVKRPGRGVDHPFPSSAEVKKSVELFLPSPCGPSWRVIGWTFYPSFYRFPKRNDTFCAPCRWNQVKALREFISEVACKIRICVNTLTHFLWKPERNNWDWRVLQNEASRNFCSAAGMLTNYMQQNPSWEANIVSAKSRNSPNFMQWRSVSRGGGTSGVGHAVAQLVGALRVKQAGRGFDSRWCHWNFSLT